MPEIIVENVGIVSVNIQLDDGSAMVWNRSEGQFLTYYEKSCIQRIVRHYNRFNENKKTKITEPKPI